MNHHHILPLYGLWIHFNDYEAPLPAFVSPWKSGGNLLRHLQTEGKKSSVKARMKLVRSHKILIISNMLTVYPVQLLQVIDALHYSKTITSHHHHIA